MPEAAEQRDTAHADVGIVCAIRPEMTAFLSRCDRVKRYSGGKFTFRGGLLGDIRVAIVESGIGAARARQATQSLIDAHSPDWILSTGFSGALDKSLQVGDLVMADSITTPEGKPLKIDVRMASDPGQGLHVGRVVTTGHIVRTLDEKQALANQCGAIAVDMESYGVAEVCRDKSIRFMAIRVVSDDMSSDLPPEVLTVLGPTGSVRAGAVAGALLKRPSSVKDLWRMRDQSSKASEKLAAFLDVVVRRLAER